jgi:hypothetical protein
MTVTRIILAIKVVFLGVTAYAGFANSSLASSSAKLAAPVTRPLFVSAVTELAMAQSVRAAATPDRDRPHTARGR